MTAVEQLEQTIRDKDLRSLRRLMKQNSSANEIAMMAVVLLEWIGSVTPPDQLRDAFLRQRLCAANAFQIASRDSEAAGPSSLPPWIFQASSRPPAGFSFAFARRLNKSGRNELLSCPKRSQLPAQ